MMLRWGTVLLVSCGVAAGAGCSGEKPGEVLPPDAGPDAGPVGDPDAGGPSPVAEAMLPVLTPCPEGWLEEAPTTPDDVATCAPWAEDDSPDCPVGLARRPGEPACVRVGADCPAGGFPDGLPVDAVFVRAGEVGGDGTRAAPFGAVADGIARAPTGGVVAIAPGTYDEDVAIRRDVTLWGACTDVVLTRTGIGAVLVSDAVATLRDLRVTGVRGGFSVSSGADLTLRGVVIDDILGTAIAVLASSLDAEDVQFRDVGGVLLASVGSTVSLRRIHVDGGGDIGFTVNRSEATVTDSTVQRMDGGDPIIAFVTSGSTLGVERVGFADNLTTAIVANGGTIELSDVVVDGPPEDVLAEDPGLAALEGGRVTAVRCRLRRMRLTAVVAFDPGSTAEIRDVVIEHVVPVATADSGSGFEIGLGASVTVDRVLVRRARGNGILVTDPMVTTTLRDITVRDTEALSTGIFGRALQVQRGAVVDGERLRFVANREATVVAAGDEASLHLTDLRVLDTAERACADAGCPGAGIGVGAYLGGHLVLERFVISGSPLSGVQLARDGEVDLRDGLVSNNTVGANVQVPGYDVDRLTDRVDYRDNEINLDASELPTPSATGP